jgi:hypothetical protein
MMASDALRASVAKALFDRLDRLTLRPVRVAARSGAGVLAGEAERAIDLILAGPLPEGRRTVRPSTSASRSSIPGSVPGGGGFRTAHRCQRLRTRQTTIPITPAPPNATRAQTQPGVVLELAVEVVSAGAAATVCTTVAATVAAIVCATVVLVVCVCRAVCVSVTVVAGCVTVATACVRVAVARVGVVLVIAVETLLATLAPPQPASASAATSSDPARTKAVAMPGNPTRRPSARIMRSG